MLAGMKRFCLALLLAIGIAPAFAQAPPAVPALPDTERRTSYSISGSNCDCAVGFALYGDGTDVDAWLQVWLNGVRYLSTDPTFGWSLSSATGPIGSIPLPITDAYLTFNSNQTGTVQIVGARRPRVTSQFAENRGVAARDLNQRFTDLTTQTRELWDKTNDVAGRTMLTQPGNTMGPLPTPTSCQSKIIGFDATGLNPVCVSTPGGSISGTVGAGTTHQLAVYPSNGTTVGGQSASSYFDTVYCSTVGYIIVRLTGAWTCSQGVPLRVTWFGAVCNSNLANAATDTTAVQAALTALKSTQNGTGTLLFDGPGLCVMTSQISLANAVDIWLVGLGGATNTAAGGILWDGAANTPVVEQNDNFGSGVSNFVISCNSVTGSTGLYLFGAQDGQYDRLRVTNCQTGVHITAVSGPGTANNNAFYNLAIFLPHINNAQGVLIDTQSGALGDTDFTSFYKAGVVSDPTSTGQVAFHLGGGDSITMDSITCFMQATGDKAVEIDYTNLGGILPSNYNFTGYLTCTDFNSGNVFTNIGSPGSATFFSPITINPPLEQNGQLLPQLPGYAWPVNVWAPGADLAAQTTSQTGNLTGAISNSTASPTQMFEVCVYMVVSTTGAGGATLAWTVSWTDESGAQTQAATGIATSAKNKSNSCFPIEVTNLTAMTWATTVTGTMGAAQYGWHLKTMKLY
jgi:hypothetical protein